MTIITPIVIAIICALLFVVLLLAGIAQKKVALVIAAVAALGLCMLAGGFAIFRFSFSALQAAKAVVDGRTGEELYAIEFGTPQQACVRIVDYHYPSISDKVRICFSACPPEANRLLRQRKYDVVKRATLDITDEKGVHCCRSFFTPARFGDTVFECLSAEGANVYTLYCSTDSTRVYYIREIK